MSKLDKLISAVGVDYTQLRDLLAAGQWQKADEETRTIMLKLACRVTAGWLREEDIQEFPCPDIQTIDQLWVKYSQERFGFIVQSRIWESVGRTTVNLAIMLDGGCTATGSTGGNTLTWSSACKPRLDIYQLRHFLRPVERLSGGLLAYRQSLWTAMPKTSEGANAP